MSEIPTQRFTHAEIAEILPQSDPFMFLDSAESAGDGMRAEYRVRGDEFFLKGHFKNEPVFPASIVFEALGQVACLWLLVNARARFGAALTAGHVFFASMDGAHFYRRVGPGETF
ncbi:MAG TPA: hypothetical protein VG733_09085, partial [Chthoniobacteraceae bacterium]|nr:hypothetical protein [Chthoniobacteraceae bacterium]